MTKPVKSFRKMYSFYDKMFSAQQCGFEKDLNAQHCIIRFLAKYLGQDLTFLVLLIDLSNAFDCLPNKFSAPL